MHTSNHQDTVIRRVWLAQDGDYKGNAEEGEQYEKETLRKRTKQGKRERSWTILEAFSTGSFEEKSALSRTPDSELRSPEILRFPKVLKHNYPQIFHLSSKPLLQF